jgi:hypothetical protein
MCVLSRYSASALNNFTSLKNRDGEFAKMAPARRFVAFSVYPVCLRSLRRHHVPAVVRRYARFVFATESLRRHA